MLVHEIRRGAEQAYRYFLLMSLAAKSHLTCLVVVCHGVKRNMQKPDDLQNRPDLILLEMPGAGSLIATDVILGACNFEK